MSLVDQVKFDSPNPDVLVWKFPSEELKLGSQLIVNQSQEAVFVKTGKALDVFGAGVHTLTTGNLPFIGGLIKFPFGNKTPFTAEVWFVNKTVRRGLKWGTKGPIQIMDPIYHYPVSVRAFGEWGIRIVDSQSFVNQIVGSQLGAESGLIEEYFSGEIVQKLSNYIADYMVRNAISVFDINTKINQLSQDVLNQIIPEFERFGIEIVNFNLERISIPQEELRKFQEVFGKNLEISQLNNATITPNYTAIKTLEAFDKAAGSGTMGAFVGAGFGAGAGFPIGQQLSKNIGVNTDNEDYVVKLQKLKSLFDAGLITQEEFDRKKQDILSTI